MTVVDLGLAIFQPAGEALEDQPGAKRPLGTFQPKIFHPAVQARLCQGPGEGVEVEGEQSAVRAGDREAAEKAAE